MTVCPLCASDSSMTKPRLLYDLPICGGCWRGFAVRRQGAFLIDCILMYVLLYVPMLANMWIQNRFQLLHSKIMIGLSMVLSALAWVLLFPMKDGFSGQSMGKAWMGVQVRSRASGSPAGFLASWRRNLLLGVPAFLQTITNMCTAAQGWERAWQWMNTILLIGIGIQLTHGFRLGDGWAGTRVIWLRYADKPPFVIGGSPA